MKTMRSQIISALGRELKKDPAIFAFWLEGADAHNVVDEYSDMDVWLDVRDGYEKRTVKKIQAILSEISPIDFQHEINHPDPKIHQTFFHLRGTSEFLIIDVCVQSHSRKFFYTKGNVDEKVKIIFEKGRVIKFRKLNKLKLKAQTRKREAELEKTFLFFQAWVGKGIKRGDFLEALKYYHSFVLDPLVELLRIRHEPTKRDFGLKHIKRDLPKRLVERVEDLYKIGSAKDILLKTAKANRLFDETLKND